MENYEIFTFIVSLNYKLPDVELYKNLLKDKKAARNSGCFQEYSNFFNRKMAIIKEIESTVAYTSKFKVIFIFPSDDPKSDLIKTFSFIKKVTSVTGEMDDVVDIIGTTDSFIGDKFNMYTGKSEKKIDSKKDASINSVMPFLCSVFKRENNLGSNELFDKNIFRFILPNLLPYTYNATINLREKIERVFYSLEKFNNLLILSGSVLAGSMPLSCFVKNKWNDIDIFTSNGKFELMLANRAQMVKSSSSTKNYGEITHIARIVKYKLGGCIINIINFNNSEDRNSIKQKIYEKFDFDVCTINWDGKEWNWAPYLNIEEMMKKRINIKNPSTYDQFERIARYKDKGFTFVNEDFYEPRSKLSKKVVPKRVVPKRVVRERSISQSEESENEPDFYIEEEEI